MILAEHDRVGRRPLALWEFDVPGGWQAHGETEAEAVYHLLRAGELTPTKRDGLVPVDNEVSEIEEQWRNEIRIELLGRAKPPLTIDAPLTTYGTPTWFYREHAPGILAELERERTAAGRPCSAD